MDEAVEATARLLTAVGSVQDPENRPNRTMPPAPSSPRPIRRVIGYARVSTEDQATDAQVDELRAAGCRIVHEEHGSGASRARPVLAKLRS